MFKIPLNFLPTFVEVARQGSVRSAAKVLHLTHGAVSQQISELENRLGFLLFDRQSKRLVLNAAGALLLHTARQALADIDDGVRRAAGAARQASCTLRLTMPATFAQRWFVPRLQRWYEQHPDILLEVDVSAAFRDLYRDGFDAAIRSSHFSLPGVSAIPLHDAPVRIVAVAAPALAQRLQACEPAALIKERLLGFREDWGHWFATAGLMDAPTPVATFNSQTLLLNAAEQGLGIGLAREILVADAIHRDALRPLFGIACVLGDALPHSLVYPASSEDFQPLVNLRTWLRREARDSLPDLNAPAETGSASA